MGAQDENNRRTAIETLDYYDGGIVVSYADGNQYTFDQRTVGRHRVIRMKQLASHGNSLDKFIQNHRTPTKKPILAKLRKGLFGK